MLIDRDRRYRRRQMHDRPSPGRVRVDRPSRSGELHVGARRRVRVDRRVWRQRERGSAFGGARSC
ncbi:hypothetical protein HBB16_12695 [Pseudonocardia sp. MCCB 268]|nr:hypothetical protein [Pseudonocardia cytotoxica]